MKDETITVGSLISSLILCYILGNHVVYGSLPYYAVLSAMLLMFGVFCYYFAKSTKDIEE